MNHSLDGQFSKQRREQKRRTRTRKERVEEGGKMVAV